MKRLDQIITVGEARKLLGKEGSSLSDDQVSELITTLSLLAKQFLRKNGSKKVRGHVFSTQRSVNK